MYTISQINQLINQYTDKGGELYPVEEGCLLDYGLAILKGEGLKTIIIKEKYLNEWSSAYTLRLYNKTPKKYEKILEDLI